MVFFCSVQLTTAQGFQSRRSDIWTTTDHTKCKVEQGDNLSFLDCPGQFEIYQTDRLVASPYEKVLYGEKQSVVSARQTLEARHSSRITWLLNNTSIYTAEELPDGTVYKKKIMMFQIEGNKTVENLWVFDSFVAMQLANSSILIFEKPLIIGLG